jgi:uncharacterized protein YdaU (DUF1376 family)
MGLFYMPFSWGDYWRDTGHLSDSEHVSYLKLISYYWHNKSLPSDDERLARIVGRSLSEWMAMKPTLQSFFSEGWTHQRIERDLVKQNNLVIRGKKGADARWNA